MLSDQSSGSGEDLKKDFFHLWALLQSCFVFVCTPTVNS